MRKIIARIVAVMVCAFAAFVIYNGMSTAYFHQAIKDFILQGENFYQNKPVDPESVKNNTANGEFVYHIAVYWKGFQDLNNQMDTETNKMLGAFDPKNLTSVQAIEQNLERMEQYRGVIQTASDMIEKNAQDFIKNISSLDQEELKLGNIQQVKADTGADEPFRKDIANVRKTIASYMYSALEFLRTRQATISFAENGAITFANPADQKYFYDLLEVVRQSDAMLKDMLAKNRDTLRGDITTFKAAYQKAM